MQRLRTAAPKRMRTDGVDEPWRSRKRRAHRVDLAGADGTQQCFDCLVVRRSECLQAIDLRLHGTLAAKSVFARERKLRAGELGAGVALAKLVELLLGGFSQPIKIGPRWERLRHGTPSFVAPVSACAG